MLPRRRVAGEPVCRIACGPHLRAERRLWLGVEAQHLGRGAVKAIAQATWVHPDTVRSRPARSALVSEGSRAGLGGIIPAA